MREQPHPWFPRLALYGRHGGPGYGDYQEDPQDPIDAVFYRHDRDYVENPVGAHNRLLAALPGAIARTLWNYFK